MSYSPTIGRWVEQDSEGYVDGPNLYQMELSAPTELVDPDGTQAGPTSQPSPHTLPKGFDKNSARPSDIAPEPPAPSTQPAVPHIIVCPPIVVKKGETKGQRVLIVEQDPDATKLAGKPMARATMGSNGKPDMIPVKDVKLTVTVDQKSADLFKVDWKQWQPTPVAASQPMNITDNSGVAILLITGVKKGSGTIQLSDGVNTGIVKVTVVDDPTSGPSSDCGTRSQSPIV